jgi:hypothetical protein
MNLLHAATPRLVGSWLTGWAAYDPLVRDAFCTGPHERIAGFFFIGSPGRPLEERPRPDLAGGRPALGRRRRPCDGCNSFAPHRITTA